MNQPPEILLISKGKFVVAPLEDIASTWTFVSAEFRTAFVTCYNEAVGLTQNESMSQTGFRMIIILDRILKCVHDHSFTGQKTFENLYDQFDGFGFQKQIA